MDENTGTVTLRASFPNPDGLLLPGMFVNAVFDQAIQPSAFLVPQAALQRDFDGSAYVFVVSADNKAQRRKVTAARTSGTNWVISAGLRAGERVITQGLGDNAGTIVEFAGSGWHCTEEPRRACRAPRPARAGRLALPDVTDFSTAIFAGCLRSCDACASASLTMLPIEQYPTSRDQRQHQPTIPCFRRNCREQRHADSRGATAGSLACSICALQFAGQRRSPLRSPRRDRIRPVAVRQDSTAISRLSADAAAGCGSPITVCDDLQLCRLRYTGTRKMSISGLSVLQHPDRCRGFGRVDLKRVRLAARDAHLAQPAATAGFSLFRRRSRAVRIQNAEVARDFVGFWRPKTDAAST